MFSLSLSHSVQALEEACFLEMIIDLEFLMEFELLNVADSHVNDRSDLVGAWVLVAHQMLSGDVFFVRHGLTADYVEKLRVLLVEDADDVLDLAQ